MFPENQRRLNLMSLSIQLRRHRRGQGAASCQANPDEAVL
jgi:hypothetical protein